MTADPKLEDKEPSEGSRETVDDALQADKAARSKESRISRPPRNNASKRNSRRVVRRRPRRSSPGTVMAAEPARKPLANTNLSKKPPGSRTARKAISPASF
jgi:hypothetical protein